MFSLSCQVSSLSSFTYSSCFPAYCIIFPRRNELPLGTVNFCLPRSLAIAMTVRITTPIPQMSCGLVSPLSSFLFSSLLSSLLSLLPSSLLCPLSCLPSSLLSFLSLLFSPFASLLSPLLFCLLALLSSSSPRSSLLFPLSSLLASFSSLLSLPCSPLSRFPGRVSPVSQSGQAARFPG